jgi:hypothetical protein
VQCPPNVAAVISRFAELVTFAVSDVLAHIVNNAPAAVVAVYPRLDESSVWCEPTTVQLAAEAIDGMTKAHNAIAVTERNTPFFENFFMSILLVGPGSAETDDLIPSTSLPPNAPNGT